MLTAIGGFIIDLTSSSYDQDFPALILAAGASSRFGRPKALLNVPGQGGAPDRDGTLLDRAICQARLLSPDVRVLCGAWYPLIRFRAQQQPSRWLRVPDWQEGLSASLKTGLASLGPRVKGVFVLVADQPLLDEASLTAFAKAARFLPHQPVAADYHGRPGVPAYLPRWLWPGVMGLQGDQGAGRLLASVNATRVDLPGVHEDVDTPDDWRLIRRRLSQTGRTARQYQR